MDNYHLTRRDDDWKLQRQGADRAAMTFEDKKSAVEESAKFMRQHGGSLKIHSTDGKFQEERTYPRSADPRKSRG